MGGRSETGLVVTAPVVDEVIAQQVVRLKKLAGRGKAD